MQTDILYVEDNIDHAELVLRHLERRQLRQRVVHVDDGERAMLHLECVAAGTAPRPCLVLLDLRLPRVDGMDVLAHIKASTALRGIPVVVFTTSGADRDLNDAAARYANSYLVKPDDHEQLNAVLDELSHYWLDVNRGAT